MTLSNPILEKVFLSLRPNFFPDYHKEHITLRYYNRVRWDVLLKDCAKLDKQLPAIITPIIYSSWQSNVDGKTFNGLLVESKGSEVLDHLQMPHITITQEMLFDANLPLVPNLEPQIVDRLWIGKKIDGQFIWANYSGYTIGEYNGQFGTAPESVPPTFQPTALPL